MLKWSPYPFVRFTVVLIGGILCGELYNHYEPEIIALLAVVFFLIYILISGILKKNTFTRFRMLIGFLGLTSIFLTGLFRCVSIHERFREEEIQADIENIKYYSAWIISQPVNKNDAIRFIATITSYKVSGKWRSANSSVSIYYKATSDSTILKYGDRILISGNPDWVKPPANQYVFNYQKWMTRKGIHYQAFLKDGSMCVYGNAPRSKLMQVSYNLRARISNIIINAFDDPVTMGIVSALVIGQRNNLDPDVADDFSRSGVYHILAVSGLHVGIVYFIMMFIFGRLNRSKPGRWVFAIITIISLICYSVITGLSPSVIRAATMLSLIPVSQAINRRANIFNTISFSAFLHLLYDPFLIFSAGFQLSYLAVLGIVLFYKPIYNLIELNSYIFDRIWKLWSVSIAAQIMTFPLTIHYFNQFPVVFLISNVVMIPVAFITVMSGFLMLALSPFNLVVYLTSSIVHHMLIMATIIIKWLNTLQGDIFSNIHLSFTEAGMLYLILAFLMLLLTRKKMIYLILSIAVLLSFTVHRISWINTNRCDTKLMVYYYSRNEGIEFIHGLKGVVMLEDDNIDNNRIVKNLVYPVTRKQARSVVIDQTDLMSYGISSCNVQGINLYVWQLKTIAVLTDPDQLFENPKPISVDVAIVKPPHYANAGKMFNYIEADHWVYSGWIKDGLKSTIDSLAVKKGIKVYYPVKKGFSEIEL
ncbi:ComEC/Rec2 family competence protein [Bacteroidota bacterium]